MGITKILLIAPDWSEQNEYDHPTEIADGPWSDATDALTWLLHGWGIVAASSTVSTDGAALYVVPEHYRHCRFCGLHGADDGAWKDASPEINACDDGSPDPHGGICPECQG